MSRRNRSASASPFAAVDDDDDVDFVAVVVVVDVVVDVVDGVSFVAFGAGAGVSSCTPLAFSAPAFFAFSTASFRLAAVVAPWRDAVVLRTNGATTTKHAFVFMFKFTPNNKKK